MAKGTLVRMIEQDTDDGWLNQMTIKDGIGIILDTQVEDTWVSGHGPYSYETCLVAWDCGSVKWVNSECLTSYGL